MSILRTVLLSLAVVCGLQTAQTKSGLTIQLSGPATVGLFTTAGAVVGLALVATRYYVNQPAKGEEKPKLTKPQIAANIVLSTIVVGGAALIGFGLGALSGFKGLNCFPV